MKQNMVLLKDESLFEMALQLLLTCFLAKQTLCRWDLFLGDGSYFSEQ